MDQSDASLTKVSEAEKLSKEVEATFAEVSNKYAEIDKNLAK